MSHSTKLDRRKANQTMSTTFDLDTATLPEHFTFAFRKGHRYFFQTRETELLDRKLGSLPGNLFEAQKSVLTSLELVLLEQQVR